MPAYTELGFGSVYGNAVRIANHILGGMRFRRRRATSASWIPIAASGIPTICLSPMAHSCRHPVERISTLTIQANAFRVADHLKQV